MAVLAPQTIEPGRKRRPQPLHPRHEVSLRGFDREVKVISHDDEGVQQPLAPCTRLEEAGWNADRAPESRKIQAR